MRIPKKMGSVVGLSRSKTKFSLVTVLVSCLMMVSVASADLGAPATTITSSWAYVIPTINGDIAGGEWTDATVRDFQLEMRARFDGSLVETLDARFYVKNDGTNIYAAIKIFNDDYDVSNFAWGWDGLGLLFDDNHDHVLAQGENGEGVHTFSGSAWYADNDLYFNATANTWDADTLVGKTNDGVLAWSHTFPVEESIGDWTFEMRIPLVGTDGDLYDFAITSLPKTVGYKIWFFEMDEGMDGVYPDDPAVGKNVQEIKDGSKFGNLILSTSPPPPPVGGTAVPIVAPINKPMSLAPLIWLVSATIIPIAVTLAFVKLKKKKR